MLRLRVHSSGSRPPPTDASNRHPSYFISKLHERSSSGGGPAVASIGAINRLIPTDCALTCTLGPSHPSTWGRQLRNGADHPRSHRPDGLVPYLTFVSIDETKRNFRIRKRRN